MDAMDAIIRCSARTSNIQVAEPVESCLLVQIDTMSKAPNHPTSLNIGNPVFSLYPSVEAEVLAGNVTFGDPAGELKSVKEGLNGLHAGTCKPDDVLADGGAQLIEIAPDFDSGRAEALPRFRPEALHSPVSENVARVSFDKYSAKKAKCHKLEKKNKELLEEVNISRIRLAKQIDGTQHQLTIMDKELFQDSHEIHVLKEAKAKDAEIIIGLQKEIDSHKHIESKRLQEKSETLAKANENVLILMGERDLAYALMKEASSQAEENKAALQLQIDALGVVKAEALKESDFRVAEMQKSIDNLTNVNAELSASIRAQETEINSLIKKVSDALKEAEDAKFAVADLIEDLDDQDIFYIEDREILSKVNANLDKRIRDLEKLVEDGESKYISLEEKLQASDAKFVTVTHLAAEENKENKKLIEQLSAANKKMEDEMCALRLKLAESEKSKAEATNRISNLSDKVDELGNVNRLLLAESESLKKEKSANGDEIQRLSHDLAQAMKKEADMTEELAAALEESQNNAHVMTEITTEKENLEFQNSQLRDELCNFKEEKATLVCKLEQKELESELRQKEFVETAKKNEESTKKLIASHEKIMAERVATDQKIFENLFADYQNSRATQETKIQQLISLSRLHRQTAHQHEMKLGQLNTENQEYLKKNREILRTVEQYKRSNDKANSMITDLVRKLSDKQRDNSTLKNALKILDEENSTISNKLLSIKHENDELKEQVGNLRAMMDEIVEEQKLEIGDFAGEEDFEPELGNGDFEDGVKRDGNESEFSFVSEADLDFEGGSSDGNESEEKKIPLEGSDSETEERKV